MAPRRSVKRGGGSSSLVSDIGGVVACQGQVTPVVGSFGAHGQCGLEVHAQERWGMKVSLVCFKTGAQGNEGAACVLASLSAPGADASRLLRSSFKASSGWCYRGDVVHVAIQDSRTLCIRVVCGGGAAGGSRRGIG